MTQIEKTHRITRMPDTYGRDPRFLTDKRYTFRTYSKTFSTHPVNEKIVTVWSDSLLDALDVVLANDRPADWLWVMTSDTAAAMAVQCDTNIDTNHHNTERNP